MSAKQADAQQAEAPKQEVTVGADVMGMLLGEIAALKLELQQVKMATGKMPAPNGPKSIRRQDHPEAGGAWLVTTPVENYAGVTAGVQFSGGIGIVDEDLPEADAIVHRLEHDFGYTVLAVGADDLALARKAQMRRGQQQQRTLAEKLAQPAAV